MDKPNDLTVADVVKNLVTMPAAMVKILEMHDVSQPARGLVSAQLFIMKQQLEWVLQHLEG